MKGIHVNSLTRNLRRRPPVLPPNEQDDRVRELLASQLVALRIVRRLSLVKLMEDFGYMKPPTGRLLWLRPWVYAKYKKEAERRGSILEATLAEGRLSTLQRYARFVGVKLRVSLLKPPKPSAIRTARAIRHRQKVLRRKYGQPRRRLVL